MGWREGTAGGGSEGGAVRMEREVRSVGAGSAGGEAAFGGKKFFFEAQEGSSNGRGHKGYVVAAWSRCVMSWGGQWLSRRSKVCAVREALPRRDAGVIGESSVAEFVGGRDRVAAPWEGRDGRTENYKGGRAPRVAELPGTHSRPCVSCLGRRAW